MSNNEIYNEICDIAEHLFINKGYVMNLNNSRFKQITESCVDESVKDRYGESKGESLMRFLNDEPQKGPKLIGRLLSYYNSLPKDNYHRSDPKDELAERLQHKLAILRNGKTLVYGVKDAHEHFNDEYISQEIERMVSCIKESPNDAISKAKNLLENCFKFILERYDIEYKNDDILQLQKKVFVKLDIDANTNSNAKKDNNVKRILSSFNQIVQGIAELRNRHGTGHGSSKGARQLPQRYARLVVASSIAIVNFVWDTYNDKATKNKQRS